MKQIFAAALLFAAAPVAAQTVETATGDWNAIPEMQQVNGAALEPDVIAAIAETMHYRECVIEGQHRNNVDVDMPFLVLFKADGTVDRLVIRPLGCARAEGLLAGAVLRLVQRGGFTPQGQRRQGWFRGHIGFAISNG